MSTRLPNRIVRFPGRSIPRFKVILHRAIHKNLSSVARTLRDVAQFAEAEATFRMWDAYQNGRTLVLVTHRERAELYVAQFEAKGLDASVEPV